MNGPEHYRLAEKSLKIADEALRDAASHPSGAQAVATLASAFAQVHATLALAAATARPAAVAYYGDEAKGDRDWAHVYEGVS